MDKFNIILTRKWIQNELDRSLDFWYKNGRDLQNGGLFTCLDRKGQVYSTDKSVWMQGRSAWTYSFAYNHYQKKSEWKALAESCLSFLDNHCFNPNVTNRMLFMVTADGKPLRQRRYWFSECFYTIAHAEHYRLTKSNYHLSKAKSSYDLVYCLKNHLINDPTGLLPKEFIETRTLRSLASPMIFLNMSNVLMDVDPSNRVDYLEKANECIEDIINYHFKPYLGCTLESTGLDGEFFSDISSGRVVNPGHDFECAWFLMESAKFFNQSRKNEIISYALKIIDQAMISSWDSEYGGIYYLIDCLGKPPEAYEHDMKLWWPHNEAMIATIMAYKETKDEKYLIWFNMVVDYCKKCFCDPEYGEWFGYLRRDGIPTEPSAKGSTFKGPFHLPRALIMADALLCDLNDTF